MMKILTNNAPHQTETKIRKVKKNQEKSTTFHSLVTQLVVPKLIKQIGIIHLVRSQNFPNN